MKAILLTMIAFVAIIGTVSADYVQYTNPVAKDLSNLNQSEIQAIFGSSGWIMSDAGGAGWTPSINAFLTDRGEGIPENVTPRTPLRCGGM
jgi:hypothetical protein